MITQSDYDFCLDQIIFNICKANRISKSEDYYDNKYKQQQVKQHWAKAYALRKQLWKFITNGSMDYKEKEREDT